MRGFRAIGKGVSSKVQVKGQGFERGEEIYSRIVKRIWVSKNLCVSNVMGFTGYSSFL